ncbi:kinase-like domain-containing protein [Suillus paluster]|uniref:kinase-like domain-containing protein n=1 Tax=Suillus paluster TaxID=48578 RepID=UPI001B883D2E|nr:kinase-like domain-containing protein [Suillus paluster]KAG1728741.1 kinase-like domain-containing protein [Suillus paluster]
MSFHSLCTVVTDYPRQTGNGNLQPQDHRVAFKVEPPNIPATTIQRLEQFANGSGGLGDVWKCSMSTQSETRTVAVKSIRVPHTSDIELVKRTCKRIRREAYVWIKMSHDHILPFEGVTEDFGPLPALVSPWMENGSLNDYLRREFSKLSDHRKLELIQQVASGLSYLHGRDIVHGDLTGTNVLVDSSGRLRLADFGLSIILAEAENTTFNSCHPGNTRWMAPEALGDEKPTKAGDIYSYGCVMLQIFSGKKPYETIKSAFAVMSAVFEGREPFDGIQSYGVYGQLSTRCLNRISAERPTIDHIMQVLGPKN